MFIVKDSNGAEIKVSGIMTSFRGEKFKLLDCVHPRKLYAESIEHGYRQEFFAGVFDVTIEEV